MESKMRKVDYYGTLGPSSESTRVLEGLIYAGMTGIRINLSHCSLEDSKVWLNNLEEAEKQTNSRLKLLIDLQGPELRIGKLNTPIELKDGQEVFLGRGGIPVPIEVYENLPENQKILLDDGLITLEAIYRDQKCWHCRVINGGILKSRKSIALPGVDIRLPALTASDYQNISLAKDYGVTGVMQPFVRSREDLMAVKAALDKEGAGNIDIFAKIENKEGVVMLPQLINSCHEIVIARGDLGNSMPLWKLPGVQKSISSYCREMGKPFMVVTQMLNSMQYSPVPTRAEVMDIYNAVKDGASSLMLTGETAAGRYPVDAMKYLVATGQEALGNSI
jgi:pyruvate kinase